LIFELYTLIDISILYLAEIFKRLVVINDLQCFITEQDLRSVAYTLD